MGERQRIIVAEVYNEWRADGRMHDPPDDTSQDDDPGFWAEVERRWAQAGLVDVAGKHRPLLDYLADK